ncbi:MAG TPA: MFS transporter, partial [Terriglobales bacterium]|nr:MFS transporter [Terriglobales bacterium]
PASKLLPMAEQGSNNNSAPTSSWRFALRALRHRNYRLFFSGQSISLIGTWMTRLATSWLVYRLTNSAFLLGLTGFASQVPAFVLGPVAGVWVDRLNRHRVLVVTQVLSMIQSFLLAALALSHRITFHDILWLSLFQGVINAFDMPARQAFVTQMVETRDDLPNAIALNSSMVNASRLIGPSIAGIVIAAVGEGWCFFIDGASYIAVIISLLLMRITVKQVTRKRESVVVELREGWRYVSTFKPIRAILLSLATISLFGMPYTVLLPIFARDVLHGGAHTLGFLTGASGVGALASAAYLASRKTVLGLGKVIPTVTIIFGVSMIAFGLSHWLVVSMFVLLFAGFGMMQQMAASNTILQTIVEEDKRGRVMAFYSMAFMGMAPFGSLMAGSVAARVGAPITVMICGCVCILGALIFLSQLKDIRAMIRPIYVKLGILPEMALGVQQASTLQSGLER